MEESSYPHQNDILFRTEQNDQKKESSLKGEKNTFILFWAHQIFQIMNFHSVFEI